MYRISATSVAASALVTGAAIAGSFAVVGSASASPAPVRVTPPHHVSPVRQLRGACVRAQTFGIGSRTYMCAEQAPPSVCIHALRTAGPCFWFTGTRHQIVWNATGRVWHS